MHCRDFERLWNEQLDAREAAPPERERQLEAHAAACPACGAVARRYQALRQALRALEPAPALPADFATRVLAASQEPPKRFRRPGAWLVPLAAAAALVLLISWSARPRRAEPKLVGNPPAAIAATPAPEPTSDSLTTALTEATSATWDLARATSAPAARIGREVIGSAVEPHETGRLALPIAPSSELLQHVGERVQDGVKPLSGTARHAFGFLFGSVPDAPPAPPAEREGTS